MQIEPFSNSLSTPNIRSEQDQEPFHWIKVATFALPYIVGFTAIGALIAGGSCYSAHCDDLLPITLAGGAVGLLIGGIAAYLKAPAALTNGCSAYLSEPLYLPIKG